MFRVGTIEEHARNCGLTVDEETLGALRLRLLRLERVHHEDRAFDGSSDVEGIEADAECGCVVEDYICVARQA